MSRTARRPAQPAEEPEISRTDTHGAAADDIADAAGVSVRPDATAERTAPEGAKPGDDRFERHAQAEPAADPVEHGDQPEPGDERYLRLAADFENFRRRKAQELADRSRYASEDAARALLPVLDNLRRAVEHAPEAETTDGFLDGLQLVVREFETALERLGVTPIDSVGQPFDPALHEALGGEEQDGLDVDTVSAELQRGYRLHDRVVRPALVRVAHPRDHVVSA